MIYSGAEILEKCRADLPFDFYNNSFGTQIVAWQEDLSFWVGFKTWPNRRWFWPRQFIRLYSTNNY